VQEGYNSETFKSKIVRPLALAVIFISLVTWQRPVSASTDINVGKLAEFFVEKVEGVRAATSNMPPPSCIRQDASQQLLSSFHWLPKCGKWWRVRLSKVPLSTETVNGVGWRLETIGVTHPLWKISGYATAWVFTCNNLSLYHVVQANMCSLLYIPFWRQGYLGFCHTSNIVEQSQTLLVLMLINSSIQAVDQCAK